MDVKLRAKHIIMLSKLVSKMQLVLDLKDKTQTQLGVDLVFGILSNIHKAEKEFYDLLADLSGINIIDIPNTEIKDLVSPLTVIVNEVTNFLKPTA